LGLIIVLGRLFYWQIIRGPGLRVAAEGQYLSRTEYVPSRGRILTQDGYTLVDNQTVYRLFAEPKVLHEEPDKIAEQILPLLLAEDKIFQEATESAVREEYQRNLLADLEQRLVRDKSWVSLDSKISQQAKQQIEELGFYGIGFDPYEVRSYPEASLSAHITGFVGKNEQGEDTGYFGIEGALDKELRGVTISEQEFRDARGLRLLFSDPTAASAIPGRDVVLTVRRDIQAIVEELLEEGVTQFGAKSGEVVIMEPSTGRILALAAWPKYDQETFYEYEPNLYKNPSLTDLYEPGSTLKTLTVAAGLDTDSIQEDTQCPNCDGPIQIGKYTIRTWNNEYHPDITMTDALAKSDNTAMIFIAQQISKDVFIDYIHRFGIGDPLGIDLQEDTPTPLRERWGDIDLATASFGQGIVTNSLQLVRAVATIANQGKMMHPHIVEAVIDGATGERITTQPYVEREVISPETATQVTRMMIAAADHGEAQWISSPTHTIAGKTGTSQVAIEGGYDEEKTIASFIGFSPPENPQFVMLVKLNEPTTSPWAAETAAPLWYKIANRLFLLLEVPPDRVAE
jgi:cell division protein FtsI/penicillin-binding protein 2